MTYTILRSVVHVILEIEKYVVDYGDYKKNRKRCLVRCDRCAAEGWREDYYAIKRRTEHICRSCSSKRTGSLNLGRPSPLKGKKRKRDCEYIVGSTYLNSSGYLEEYVGRHAYPDRKGGYYLQHRKIVEAHLGRRLGKDEKIHHINGNKSDNRLENLLVCQSMSEHKHVHNQIQTVFFEALIKGLFIFDEPTKKYKLAPEYSDILEELGEFRENLSSKEYDNPEPSLSYKEGATTISQESRAQESSKRPTSPEDDDIVCTLSKDREK